MGTTQSTVPLDLLEEEEIHASEMRNIQEIVRTSSPKTSKGEGDEEEEYEGSMVVGQFEEDSIDDYDSTTIGLQQRDTPCIGVTSPSSSIAEDLKLKLNTALSTVVALLPAAATTPPPTNACLSFSTLFPVCLLSVFGIVGLILFACLCWLLFYSDLSSNTVSSTTNTTATALTAAPVIAYNTLVDLLAA